MPRGAQEQAGGEVERGEEQEEERVGAGGGEREEQEEEWGRSRNKTTVRPCHDSNFIC